MPDTRRGGSNPSIRSCYLSIRPDFRPFATKFRRITSELTVPQSERGGTPSRHSGLTGHPEPSHTGSILAVNMAGEFLWRRSPVHGKHRQYAHVTHVRTTDRSRPPRPGTSRRRRPARQPPRWPPRSNRWCSRVIAMRRGNASPLVATSSGGPAYRVSLPARCARCRRGGPGRICESVPHITSYREELPFDVWFTRILVNGCLDWRKSADAAAAVGLPMPAGRRLRARPVDGRGASSTEHQRLVSRERWQQVTAAVGVAGSAAAGLHALPLADTAAAEVSGATGLSEATVRVHLSGPSGSCADCWENRRCAGSGTGTCRSISHVSG